MSAEREKHLRFMTRTRPAGLDKDAVEWTLAEIERLRAALETIAGLPDVRCDEAPTVARNTLNDGTRAGPFPTEPDSGPDVLGERKGEE